MNDKLEFEVSIFHSDAAGIFCIQRKWNITSLQTNCFAVYEEVTATGTEEAVEKPPKKKTKKMTQSHMKWKGYGNMGVTRDWDKNNGEQAESLLEEFQERMRGKNTTN